MRRWIMGMGIVVLSGTTGCGDRKDDAGVASVNAVSAGEFHNEVLAAFDRQAPLSSVVDMQWDEWLAITLSSMEEVSLEHGLPFERATAEQEIVQLARVFRALKEATGIDPGMLRERPSPEDDLATLVGQLNEWKLLDPAARDALTNLEVESFAARANSATDRGLRDLFEIGAASREFWRARKQTSAQVAAPDDGPLCKYCNLGSTISDFLGGVVGRIFCGDDPLCEMRTAAAASMIYDMLTNGPPDDWDPLPILP